MSQNDMLGEITPVELAGLMTTWWQRVGGSDGRIWLAAFKRFLRKENPWPTFKTWRTIELGTHKTIEDLIMAVEKDGTRIYDSILDDLKRVKLASQLTEIELVVVSGADLGFQEGAPRLTIYERAFRFGLRLCPAEVGPQLRRQYTDQPHDEWLVIAMEPIKSKRGDQFVISVGSENVQYLWTKYGGNDPVWSPKDRWVFYKL